MKDPQKQDKNRKADGTFEKGASGNPGGRPKGSISITRAIRGKLGEVYPGKSNKEKAIYLDKIIETIFHNAIELKDSRSLKDIWSYIDGQPKAPIEFDIEKESLESLTEFFRGVANGNNR
jgi:hypothetical protein